MPSHLEIKDLPYNINQLYLLVSDVGKYPEFLPWCAAARISNEQPHKFDAELVVSFKGFSEKYTSIVSLTPPDSEVKGEAVVDVSLKEGPFKKLKNYWVLRRIDDTNTQVEFFVDFEFKNFILQKLAGAMFEAAVKKMMGAFEERAKSLIQV